MLPLPNPEALGVETAPPEQAFAFAGFILVTEPDGSELRRCGSDAWATVPVSEPTPITTDDPEVVTWLRISVVPVREIPTPPTCDLQLGIIDLDYTDERQDSPPTNRNVAAFALQTCRGDMQSPEDPKMWTSHVLCVCDDAGVEDRLPDYYLLDATNGKLLRKVEEHHVTQLLIKMMVESILNREPDVTMLLGEHSYHGPARLYVSAAGVEYVFRNPDDALDEYVEPTPN